jgi:glutamate synthase domain-containing protein 2
MRTLSLAFSPRFITLTLVTAVAVCFAGWIAARPWDGAWRLVPLVLFGGLTAVGLRDLFNTSHAVLRNYPLAAHLRFILEEIRPEMRQYFFEDEKQGTPFSRDERALVYQRAKMVLDKRPFGTQLHMYHEGHEWLNHAIVAGRPDKDDFRVQVGGPETAKPYSASVLNISAMSFGALSANAVRALNQGARRGGFAHDTGEGGLSPYHLQGGDLIWEIGSGYFGARRPDGGFCPERFAETASQPQVRMVELKLSQGAKPGHGGVLPGAKVSAEIAAVRGVTAGVDCISPSRHSAFSTPVELMEFIGRMRALSGGKPAGFKLCIGHEWEFLAICKAMLETGIYPDFVVVDGSEGGTGAAPLEFMDHIGKPMRDGLSFVHQSLRGIGARGRVKIGASGKITSAFDMARAFALGADWCNSARGFMFALGCIQSLSCHTDRCPTGVTTQDPTRMRALVVPDKATRVFQYHAANLQALAELVAAAGLGNPNEFRCAHFQRRVSPQEVRSFTDIYPPLAEGELLGGTAHEGFARAWGRASAGSFQPVG